MIKPDLNQKYNVLFVMNGAKPPRGGEFLTLNLISRLDKNLFNTTVVYAHEGPIVKEIKSRGIDTVYLPLGNKLTNIYPRKINILNPVFISKLLFEIFKQNSVANLRQLMLDKKINIVYCADNLSKLLGGMAAKLSGIKVVAHCHDDFKKNGLGISMKIVYLLLLDRILAVSDRVKKFFRTIRGNISDKVITVYNGIDADVFKPKAANKKMLEIFGISSCKTVIGSIGALETDKGQRYLIQAVSILKSEGINDIVCVICGTGPEEENLKKLARKLHVEADVIFLGFRNDIIEIISTLDILVITSVTIESFSMVAIEAMSMEVPVIATNTGALPEVVANQLTGILIQPANPDDLSLAIKNLYYDKEKRYVMGRNGRKRVLEYFTLDKNVKRIEQVFQELIKE